MTTGSLGTASQPVVGILGGMGPAATADFYAKLIAATPADHDQEHLRVVMWADPTVPDRSEAIVHGGEDPTPSLTKGAQVLKDAGADFFVAPCNGAHAFLPTVHEATGLDYLSLIDAAADHVAAMSGVDSVGILATDATVASSLYQQALEARGLGTVLPDYYGQQTVMEVIYGVKAGSLSEEQKATLVDVTETMAESGADVIIAACTEIPLALSTDESPRPLIDPAVVLVDQVVARARSVEAQR